MDTIIRGGYPSSFMSSDSTSGSLALGARNTCNHQDCILIGSDLTSEHDGQILVGSKDCSRSYTAHEFLALVQQHLCFGVAPLPSGTAYGVVLGGKHPGVQ